MAEQRPLSAIVDARGWNQLLRRMVGDGNLPAAAVDHRGVVMPFWTALLRASESLVDISIGPGNHFLVVRSLNQVIIVCGSRFVL